MAQGSRGRWLRATAAGLGMMLCTGLVGCLNTDKDKAKDKGATNTKTGVGLPGMPVLPPGGSVSKGAPTNPPYTGPGGNLQPNNSFATTSGGGAFRTDGSNNLKSNPIQQIDYRAQPGAGSPPISPPTQPGVYSPPGGPMPPSGFGASPDPLAPVPPLPPQLPPPNHSDFGGGPIPPIGSPPPTLPMSPTPTPYPPPLYGK